MNRTPRAAARTILPVAALALVAGCTATNPQTTQLFYQPADGASGYVGPVAYGSLMLLATAEEAPGTLVARLVNSTSEPQTVTLTSDAPTSLDETFRVPPGSTLAVGPEGSQSVRLEPIGVIPGTNVRVEFTVESTGDSTVVTVPVLSGVHDEYAELVPLPSASTPDPDPGSAAGGEPDGAGDGTGESDEDTQQDPGDVGGLLEGEGAAQVGEPQ